MSPFFSYVKGMKNDLRDTDLRTFTSWLREIGRSRASGWRWRKLGWIEAVNINGQLFVSRLAVERFSLRAARGEFARSSEPPRGRARR
jgi:hypothetical protein